MGGGGNVTCGGGGGVLTGGGEPTGDGIFSSIILQTLAQTILSGKGAKTWQTGSDSFACGRVQIFHIIRGVTFS